MDKCKQCWSSTSQIRYNSRHISTLLQLSTVAYIEDLSISSTDLCGRSIFLRLSILSMPLRFWLHGLWPCLEQDLLLDQSRDTHLVPSLRFKRGFLQYSKRSLQVLDGALPCVCRSTQGRAFATKGDITKIDAGLHQLRLELKHAVLVFRSIFVVQRDNHNQFAILC